MKEGSDDDKSKIGDAGEVAVNNNAQLVGNSSAANLV